MKNYIDIHILYYIKIIGLNNKSFVHISSIYVFF